MTDFEPEDWIRARTLEERKKERRGDAGVAEAAGARGRKRLDRWSRQPPFDQAGVFAQRLAAEGLTVAHLAALLDEAPETAAGGGEDRPAWVSAWGAGLQGGPGAEAEMPPPAQWSEAVGYEFWAFVEPVLRGPFDSLARQLENLSLVGSLPPLDSEKIRPLLARTLPYELLAWPLRTMVLELNVARLQGELQGPDAPSRFREFIGRLKTPERSTQLLQEYCVLARQLAEAVESWRSTTLELVLRLGRDWPAILETFPECGREDRLAGIRIGAGDRHRGGRTVAILTFRSGFRLVYKPRGLAVDARFQDLLATLNEWGSRPALAPVTIVEREGYGWMEYVAPRACSTEAEVRRFYERQGAYLALLYALGSTDIHFENVIARGEHPIIIELESLLSPGPPIDDPGFSDVLSSSVLRIGLLPIRAWENEKSAGLDVSALGGPDGQLPPRPEPYWEGRSTDAMHYSRRSSQITASSAHRPSLEDRPVSALDYAEEILGGFERTYRLLLGRRDDLLAPGGPLAVFEQEDVRVLLRGTAVYTLMLRESFHPDYLRDAMDRELFFDKLWVQVPKFPHLASLVVHEKRDLWRGDIPIFTVRADSRHLDASDGERIEDYFSASPMDHVRARLAAAGESDLARQLWIARASLAILSTAKPEAEPGGISIQEGSEAPPAPPREELLRLAAAIGDRICSDSILEGDDVRWLGLVPLRQGSFKIALLNENLYSGLAGVAFFLAYLGRLHGSERYTRLAEAACQTLLRSLRRESEVATRVGAFDGLGGILYLLSHLATLWERGDLVEEAMQWVDPIQERIDRDESFDVVSGSAGCILGLSSLYRRNRSSKLLDAMVRCGRRLEAGATETAQGIGWVTTWESSLPMTGFAHGAAGIAAALIELSQATGDSRFRDLAGRALAYERHQFAPAEGNWADLRQEEGRYQQVNWCHGAPGIGLGRLRILAAIEPEEAVAEIRQALETTMRRGFGRNHCLCHGDLGNLDLVLAARSALGGPDLEAALERLTSVVVRKGREAGWRCGLPMEIETPGLMTGLAGIGYGLLRLAQPEAVPSVLILAPPVET